MSVEVPQPFRAKVEGPIGPMVIDGIPTEFHVSVEKLPKIQIGVDPLAVAITQLPKVQIGLDAITLNPVTLNPVELNLSIDRIPDVRAHLPADFTVGLSILGLDLFAIRLTGEAQVITEPYRPNPCEVSAPVPARPPLTALPPLAPEDHV